MKVYEIDKDGNYLGEHDCQPCPVTGGWLYPTYYTEALPPEGEYESVKFISGKWETEAVKTLKEKIEAGVIILTEDQIFDDKLDAVRMKNIDELKADKLITADEWYTAKSQECLNLRKSAYLNLSDGLFFDYQRGEIDKTVWEDKVKEIKLKYPKPVK